jgi:hypothetical protein
MTLRLTAGRPRQAAALHMRCARGDEADGEQVAKHVCRARCVVPLRFKKNELSCGCSRGRQEEGSVENGAGD